jgi:Zn-dependent peptidase ImmA (M78 family)
MLAFIKKVRSLGCKWNEKELNESDFHHLCKRHKIKVVEMPLRVSGFYYSVLGRHYIAINSRLKHPKKLFVMFHEFAHYLMHAPDLGVTASFHGVGRKTRKETEADVFAACALIPRAMIENRSAQELVEEDGLPESLVSARMEIYRFRGF